jgi:crossover junction endodeoxyribonuclease RusA
VSTLQALRTNVFPFEFTVQGLPISHQTHNRAKLQAWKEAVRAAAHADWPGIPPTTELVQLKVICYYDTDPPDVDNFHKPIQDALQGLVYVSDAQVTDAAPAKRDINGSFYVRYMPAILARAFERGDEFVHVIVELAPDQGVLIR